MFDLVRLYLANILRPVLEDAQLIQDIALFGDDGPKRNRESDQTTSGDDSEGEMDEGEAESRSQVLSLSGSDWNEAQLARKPAGAKKSSVASRSNVKREKRRRKGRLEKNLDNRGLLDSSGPKLIYGARSWLVMFQIIGQLNWLGLPFYLSLVYKTLLYAMVIYVYVEHFVKPQMQAHIVDSHYRNPILMFIGALAIVTTLMHTLLTIYSNLFNLCPLFKVLTTPKLCFIKKEVQHIVGNKSLFFMLIFHVYQCILLQMLALPNLNEFFNQFQVGRFMLDSFVVTVVSYFFFGVIQIDFYIRICFGFWIIAMKTNLEYRFAYLQRLNRVNRIASSTTSDNPRRSRLPRNRSNATPIDSPFPNEDEEDQQEREGEKQQHQDMMNGMSLDGKMREGARSETSEACTNIGTSLNDECRSQNSLATDTTANYSNKQRPTTAQSRERTKLNNFKEKYKLDTMDEIQKNLNTMDDHLEVCRGIQNGSLVLITLNAFLTNGTLLLIAYHLLANQGKNFHGVIVILLVANNTLLIFLCYIGDSWISYALASFVQTVEDEYFLQGGDDCTSVKQPPVQPKSLLTATSTDSVLPLNWSSTRINEASETGSEITHALDLKPKDQELFLIRKKDVLFCREFLHQFKNHLATPWSKLTVKIHLNMLGTFVTLIAAQIIFDREH